MPLLPHTPSILSFHSLHTIPQLVFHLTVRHRQLWSELGRYLINFEPPNFILDQRKYSCQVVKHFTASYVLYVLT